MAKIFNNDYMALPISIKRGNPAPVDTTAVWYAKADLETYAASGATAYVGQILTLVADGKCEAYMISNEAGTLVKLASTTASGDLASDVATLQTQVTDLISKVGKAAAGEDAATGLYALIDEVKALANEKVASVAKGDASVVVGGTTTAPTVKVAVSAAEDNALELADDGLKVVVPEVVHPEYSVVKDENSGDYSAVYHLTKDGANVGVAINIPKDMVVKSGSVQKFETGDLPEGVSEAGTYIVLVLANATSDKLYIKVDDLVDIYGGGAAADGIITVNVDPATKKITATIADGSITKAKLTTAVQTSLGKADSAVQKVETGSANGTIAVDGADVAVKGLADAAYATVESLNATAKGYADDAKGAVVGTADDTAEKITVYGARKYADKVAGDAESAAKTAASDAIAALDKEDTAVAKQFVSAVSETDGVISVTRRALVADDVPELGISKISGLQAAIDAKQDNLTFNTAYDAATNKAATMSDVNAAKTAVVGGEDDTKDSDTVKGAKLYADDKAASALNSAKTYADSIVSGDDGLSKRVDALENKHAEGKTVAQEVSDGIDALNLADTYAAKKATEDHIANTDIHVTAAKKTAWDGAVSDIETLNGTEATTGSVKQIAKSYADGKDEAIAAAKAAGDNAQAAVDALGKKVGDLPEGATATTVVGYVDEKVKAVKDAEVDYTVTVTPSDVAGIAKRYTIAQAATKLNVNIDIPSDMVVKSGEVVTNPSGQPEGTYLVLTLANTTNDKVYINVGDLIEYVTSGSEAGDMVYIDVSADHKVTASITDGTITKAKLAAAVQTSLGLADTAIQKAGLDSALEPYAKSADVASTYVAKNGTDRLMTAAEGEKLEAIADSAQANVIESVKVGGTALSIADKAVDITEISTDLLVQGTDVLIIDCGGAED